MIEHQTTISLLGPLSENTLTLEYLHAVTIDTWVLSNSATISLCVEILSAFFKHFVQMLAYFDRHNYPRYVRQSLFECFEITPKCHECKCRRQELRNTACSSRWSIFLKQSIKIDLTGANSMVRFWGTKVAGRVSLERYSYAISSLWKLDSVVPLERTCSRLLEVWSNPAFNPIMPSTCHWVAHSATSTASSTQPAGCSDGCETHSCCAQPGTQPEITTGTLCTTTVGWRIPQIGWLERSLQDVENSSANLLFV